MAKFSTWDMNGDLIVADDVIDNDEIVTDPELAEVVKDVKAKSPLKSLTLQGALAMLFAWLLTISPIPLPEMLNGFISDQLANMVASLITSVLMVGGLGAVGVGRARAKGPLQLGG